VSQNTGSVNVFYVSDGNIKHRVVARCPSIPSAVILACNKCCLRIYTTVSLLSLSINTSPGLTQGCSTAFWGGQQNVATLVSSRVENKCCFCCCYCCFCCCCCCCCCCYCCFCHCPMTPVSVNVNNRTEFRMVA